MKKQIEELLEIILEQMGLEEKILPQVSVPDNPLHGDYATSLPLKTKNPRKFAEELKDSILKYQTTSGAGIIERVEIAGPGFLNLFLSEASISNEVKEVLKKKDAYGYSQRTAKIKDSPDDFSLSALNKTRQKEVKKALQEPQKKEEVKSGKKMQKNHRKNSDALNLDYKDAKKERITGPDIFSAYRVIVEFADPNPFKEIHIGHVRNIALGESFCRLLEATGHEVRRANYEGDVGMHVAKALYSMLKGEDPKTAYAQGAKAFEANEQVKKEIGELNKKIYNQDPSIMDVYRKGRQWSLDAFETVYRRLGTHFDRYYFESEVAPLGMAIVHKHPQVFEQSDGAWVFRGEKVGLHTRVFVTKEGYATYEAKDLALAPLKYKEWPYDLSIIMTGNEQSEYFRVMLAALTQINPELASKTRHIAFGMVNLKSGKMSSRTGEVITADWLLDEAKKRIYNILENNRTDYSKSEKDDIAEKAAVAAVKYSMLRVTASSDIAFDIDASVSFEGDSGPYLQYTYARCSSVLRKADKGYNVDGIASEEERVLARDIIQFPDIVKDAAEHFSPNIICTYLFHLAQKFNLFYAKEQILGSESRLALTKATAQVIKNGLFLLGIDVLEKM